MFKTDLQQTQKHGINFEKTLTINVLQHCYSLGDNKKCLKETFDKSRMKQSNKRQSRMLKSEPLKKIRRNQVHQI